MNQDYEELEQRVNRTEKLLDEQFQLIQELGKKVISLEGRVSDLESIDHEAD